MNMGFFTKNQGGQVFYILGTKGVGQCFAIGLVISSVLSLGMAAYNFEYGGIKWGVILFAWPFLAMMLGLAIQFFVRERGVQKADKMNS